MADWIKLEKTTPEKPEIYIIANDLGITPGEAFLLCFKMWRYFDDQTLDGSANIGPSQLDALVQKGGFSKSAESVGWLETEDGSLVLPHFDRHNGRTAKRRAMDSRHKRNARTGHGADIVRTSCGHGADIVRTSCGHGADIVRTSCGHGADIVRTSCGHGAGQETPKSANFDTTENAKTDANLTPPNSSPQTDIPSENADTVRTSCGHFADTVRTFCGTERERELRERDILKRGNTGSSIKPSDWSLVGPRLPEEFLTSEFSDAWEEWARYRSERKKPLTKTTVTRLINKMVAWGPQRSISAIGTSVEMQWQGLYEKNKDATQGRITPKKGKYDDLKTRRA